MKYRIILLLMLLFSAGASANWCTDRWNSLLSFFRRFSSGPAYDPANPYNAPLADKPFDPLTDIYVGMWERQGGAYLYLFKPGDGPKLPPNMVLTCIDGETKLAKEINWESEETRRGFTGWGFMTPRLLKFTPRKGYPVSLSYVAHPPDKRSDNPFAD